MAFKYGMKAAVFPDQLQDRLESFRRLGIPSVIELHLFGTDDVFSKDAAVWSSGVRRYADVCRFVVHYPIMDAKTGYLFDASDDDCDRFEAVLDFTQACGAVGLVMHCCYGFNRDISKREAMTGFLAQVEHWNELSRMRGIRILLENYGFVWLPPGLGADYVTSPLDHCFPWDMAVMVAAIREKGMEAVGFLLDTAHAVLSANMFNMRRRHGHLSGDKRFRNIFSEDLDRARCLTASDFMHDSIEYFHVSDAFVWREEDNHLDEMRKWLYTENLPIGRGNVDFAEIMEKAKGDETLIMEINPEKGNHAHNISQYEAVVWFREKFG